jgi:hypothetical protein
MRLNIAAWEVEILRAQTALLQDDNFWFGVCESRQAAKTFGIGKGVRRRPFGYAQGKKRPLQRREGGPR